MLFSFENRKKNNININTYDFEIYIDAHFFPQQNYKDRI